MWEIYYTKELGLDRHADIERGKRKQYGDDSDKERDMEKGKTKIGGKRKRERKENLRKRYINLSQMTVLLRDQISVKLYYNYSLKWMLV